jgi:hypothetical protein
MAYDKAQWAPTVLVHCTALELLGKLLMASTKATSMEVRTFERVIRKVSRKTAKGKTQLGN